MENIRFLFKGVRIDERTEDYIRKRIQGIYKLLADIIQVEVEIDLDKKGKFRIELMVKTPRNLYRAEETTESIEGSTDIAINEIKNQIKKKKNKRMDLIKRGGRTIKKNIVLDGNSRFNQ